MSDEERQTTFDRGLDQAFVCRLNEMYEESSWWRAFVDDKELFLAIRENYLSVYYRGASLLRLEWKDGEVGGQVHYKYILRPRVGSKYEYARIEMAEGGICLPQSKNLFMEDVTCVADLKTAAKPHTGPEKTGVHEIIRANPHVLDTEVGFPREERYVDFAALIETREGVKIRFFEAKHFTNSSLRSRDGCPPVIEQVNVYQRLLESNFGRLIDSYRRVCGNLYCLRGLAERYPERHAILKRVAEEEVKLCIDTEPRLVVFGYDSNQEEGKWEECRKKLEEKLGKCRVISKGSARNIKLT